MRKLSFLVVLIMMIVACNDPIPDGDIQAAKQAIALAVTAEAATHDPDNLADAREFYENSLKQVVSNDLGISRESALEAKQLADLATDNSRRIIAQNTTRRAQEAYDEAIANKAAYLAEDDLERAQDLLTDADYHFVTGDWLRANSDAENAIEAAERAKSNAIRKMNELEKAISDAENAIRRADANEVVREFADEELDLAKETLDSALESKLFVDDPQNIEADNDRTRNNLAAEAYASSIESAHQALRDAEEAVALALDREREYYRQKADQRLSEAKNLLEEIRRLKEQGLIKKLVIPPPVIPESGVSSGTNGFDYGSMSNHEKYEAALEALEFAEESYDDENFLISLQKSEEAIKLAQMVKASSQPTGDEQKVQTGEKQYYVVRYLPSARDCLWRIAGYPFVYNNARLWPKIWEANRHLIQNPDLIYPGQKFEIPPID